MLKPCDLDFHCKRCGGCCIGPSHNYIVRTVAWERCAIGEYLKEDPNKYIDRSGEIMNVHGGDSCIFLLANGRCRIYPVRPTQCRSYPFWPEILRSRKTWRAEAKRCSGIGIYLS